MVNKLVRLFLVLLLVCLPMLQSVNAQFQLPARTNTNNGAAFTTTGSSPPTNLINSGVSYHTLTWWTGPVTPSSCQIKLETAATLTGSRSDLISNQACATSGIASATTGINNYVWITVTTLTGAGASVYGQYQGYINGTGSVTVTQCASNTCTSTVVQPTGDNLHMDVDATASTGATTITSFNSSTSSTNATSVKGSAGNIYAIHATNTTATIYYLRMYNLATAPTCSSPTGYVETIPVLATLPNGRVIPVGQAYTTGIAYCITSGGGSNDNGNAAAGVYVTVLYK